MNIGKAIRLCRVNRNMKQADLAEAADISVSYLSLIERGQRDPNFSTLQNIAEALRVPLSIIVFLGDGREDIDAINPEIAAQLSHLSLKLIQASNNAETPIP